MRTHTRTRLLLIMGNEKKTKKKNSVCLQIQTNFFLTPVPRIFLCERPVCARTREHKRTCCQPFGLFGHTHARVHTNASTRTRGTWFWVACGSVSSLQQTAPSSIWIRAKPHHGYALAMVTLPKRCCGSVPSPWLRTNPPSVV